MHRSILWALSVFAFTATLHAVPPLISDVANPVIGQSSSTGTLFFVVGDAETAFADLTVTASSSLTSLVPNNAANLQLGGTNSQRTIVVIPVAGQQGAATITLTVTDGEGLTASSDFQITVTAPNSRPTLTALPGHQIVSPGQTPGAVSFTVGDAETPVGSLNVVARSANTNLVPDTNIALTNNGAARSLQITPVLGQKGTAVIQLRVSDSLGAFAESEFIFSVFDPASPNNSFRQPSGIYVLDSTAGTTVGGVRMRDGNLRNLPFVDGYVLRTEWATLEPTNGVFDFTIIDNIFSKLPANQKLSLMIASGVLPSWLNTLPGVATYTGGSPSVTLPVPWNPTAQERYRLFLVALGNHVVDGVPLRDHPRLAALDPWIPGLKSGIRTQIGQIRDIPLYSRSLFEGGVLTHLANVTDNFPKVPVFIGFWTYTDATASPTAWEALRLAILAQHDGVSRPRVGFWMENLAASRQSAESSSWSGLPSHGFTAPLYDSQEETYITYQVLGSWARPFAAEHVDNNLNGSPGDGMDYGFNDFQCRYYEHYQADVDFANYTAEFQRWHDFLAALPAPTTNPAPVLTLALSTVGTEINGTSGVPLSVGFTASGGTAPYSWTVVAGSLPSGLNLGANGSLTGTPTLTGIFPITVSAPIAPTVTLTRNGDGTITLIWPSTVDAWYQVEVSGDLINWTFLGSSVVATGNTMTWTDDGSQTGAHPATSPSRFYRVRNWGVFRVSFTSTTFTYSDEQRTVNGMFLRPAGTSRLPALLINHGTGGNATGFSRTRANEMSPWGLICIGPNLTHQAGATEDLETWGYSPENLARNRACVAALSTRSDVDLNRLAMWGHSRGSFASIGVASALGTDLKVLGFTEGGILENTGLDDRDGQPEASYPTVDESAGITAKTLMFHVVGTPGDTVVVPATSLRLNTQLTTRGVVNSRVTYDSTGIITSGSSAHNIYTTTFYPDVLIRWRGWLTAHGILP
jgi:hypothetical protein